MTLFSGLLLLNLHRLNLEALGGYKSPESSVVITLRSLLRMAVQTIQLGERKIVEYILDFPFWTMHFPYLSTILLVDCEDTGFNDEEKFNGLRYTKDMLIELKNRWRIGGMKASAPNLNDLADKKIQTRMLKKLKS